MENQKRKIKLGDFTIVGLLAALILLLWLTTDTFATWPNIYSELYGVSIQFFAAIGFTFLIIMGEIDLAIGSMYGLSGILVGACVEVFKWPLGVSVLAVLAVCTVFGYVVGVLTTKFRLNSMMVTLGTMSLVAGTTAVIYNNVKQMTYDSAYRALSKFKIGDIYWTIIAMVVIAVVLDILLNRLPAMKRTYYIGTSGYTSVLYGIKADRIKRICFALSALTSAIGGIIATSRITYSSLSTGEGLEFAIITACVVGGASLTGGRGGMLKTMLGMIFIAFLKNGLTIYRIDPFIQDITVGIVLIIAVFIDVRMNAKKR